MMKKFINKEHLMNNMDLKDKKIIYEVELDARTAYSKIGKKVGLSKETTNNRIKALEREGIIQGYNTIINIAQLGYTGYAIFSRFQGVNEEKKKEVIEDLRSNRAVYWVALLGGNYDILFAIQARDVLEFNRIYSSIQNKHGVYLKDNVISIRTQVSQFHRNYLLNRKAIEKPPYFGKEIKLAETDEIDKSILNILSTDGRINVVDLAKKAGIARTTAHSRVRALEKSGIIQGYSALIHPEQFGYQVYQIMISVNSINESIKKKLYNYCLNNPNITFYVDCVGKWNFELTCETENQQKLQDILTELRTVFQENIANIEIILTFNYFLKYRLNVA